MPAQDAEALAEAESYMQTVGNDGEANPDQAAVFALMRAGRRLLWTLINDTVQQRFCLCNKCCMSARHTCDHICRHRHRGMLCTLVWLLTLELFGIVQKCGKALCSLGANAAIASRLAMPLDLRMVAARLEHGVTI